MIETEQLALAFDIVIGDFVRDRFLPLFALFDVPGRTVVRFRFSHGIPP